VGGLGGRGRLTLWITVDNSDPRSTNARLRLAFWERLCVTDYWRIAAALAHPLARRRAGRHVCGPPSGEQPRAAGQPAGRISPTSGAREVRAAQKAIFLLAVGLRRVLPRKERAGAGQSSLAQPPEQDPWAAPCTRVGARRTHARGRRRAEDGAGSASAGDVGRRRKSRQTRVCKPPLW
jgi:hypothetical protein